MTSQQESGDHASAQDAMSSPDTPSGQHIERPAQQVGAVSKKSRLPWILGGLGLLVLVAGVIAVVVINASGTPRDAAENFIGVTKQENADPDGVTIDDFRPFLCAKTVQRSGPILERQKATIKKLPPEEREKLSAVDMSVQSVNQQGDTGTVVIVGSVHGGKQSTNTFSLVKEDGAWKLCHPDDAK